MVELPSSLKSFRFIVLLSVLDFPQMVSLVAASVPKSMFSKSRLTLLPIPSTAVAVLLNVSPTITLASRARSLAKAFGV